MTTTESKPSLYLMVMLASLTAFAPFVTDMYLPALPSMEATFEVTTSVVQLGLTTSMLGLAIGQLIIGPLSDKYGRKPLLVGTLIFFVIASALCIVASNIELFIIMRFVQGIGASGGVVLSRSIATDLYHGKPLAGVMAVIGAISGIAPVLSPVVGGGVLMITSWRGIFVILLVIGIVLCFASLKLKESHPAQPQMSVVQAFAQIKDLRHNKMFLIYTAMQFCCMFVFFGQIAATPYIFQNHYGFSELAFSIFFAVNALALGVSAFMSQKVSTPQKSLVIGSTLCLGSTLCVAASLILGAPVYIFEAFMLIMLISFGLIFAPMTALAMNSARHQAGLASALFGAAGFVAGGIASPLVGVGNLLYSSSIVFIIGAFTTIMTVLLSRRMDANITNA